MRPAGIFPNIKLSNFRVPRQNNLMIIDFRLFCAIMKLEDSGVDQLSLVLKQLTVSVCSRLWSQPVGYAVTTNRIDSSELKENA